MKLFKSFVVFTLLFILAGCETAVKVKTEYVLIAPRDDMLVECPVNTPPDKEKYLASSLTDREKMLYELSLEQYKNIQKCNVQLKKLRTWKEQQLQVYKEKPSS